MVNNLVTLNAKLTRALRDATYATWTSAELDDILTWTVAELYPRISRQIIPESASITLVADTYKYDFPAGIIDVTDVILFDSSGDPVTELGGSSWFIEGDPLAGTADLRVAPAIVDAYAGGSVKLRGYGRYDLTANYPPDDFVPLILSVARQEAYRRVGADRERFKAWLSRNQNQNVSVNELLSLISEADRDAERLKREKRTWVRPVPGRQ